MKRFLTIPLLFVVCACAKESTDEQLGLQKLDEARAAYAQGNFEAARDSILSLRKNCPRAIETRRQAILLMDSVELQLAEGDSLKTEFYRRKLQHDQKELEIKE